MVPRRLAKLFVRADVAELVDAHGSGPCGGNPVEVQVLSSAYPKQAHGVGNPCANEHQERLGRLPRSASKALSSEDRAISRPTSTSEKSSAVAIPSAP